MIKFFSKISPEWIIFLIVAFFVFWQYLLNPPFSMVDDGYSITLGKSIITDASISNWSDKFFETDIGRFRPIYLLYFSILYKLFSSDPIGLWVGQTIVLWFTLVTLYKLVLFLSKNRFISYFSTFIWLLIPAVAENIFRAGTAEPRQLLFILLAMYFAIVPKKQSYKTIFIISISTIFAIGTKETSIILIPFLIYVYLAKKLVKVNKFLILVVLSITIPVMIIGSFEIMKAIFQTGYAVENFNIDILALLKAANNVIRTFTHYILIFSIALVSFSLRMFLAYFNKSIKKTINNSIIEFSLYILTLQSLFFVVAWNFHFERYFYLTWTFLVILISIEASRWISIYKKRNNLINMITSNQLFILFCFLILLSIGFYNVFFKKGILKFVKIPLQSIIAYRMSYDASQISNSIIERLLSNEIVEEVYITNDGYEIIYEVGLYSSQFQERQVTILGRNEQLPIDQKTDIYKYVENPLTSFDKSENPNKILIGTQNEFIIFPRLESNPNLIKIEPKIKFNLIDSNRHWWIIEE